MLSPSADADTDTCTEATILTGEAKPGQIQRASSESAVEVLGPIVDRDIAVLNEQRAQKALVAANDAMRLLARLVSAPIGNVEDAGGANNNTDGTDNEIEEKRVL